MCRHDHLVALAQANSCVIGAAHASGALGNRVKNRLYIRRRTRDDAQDFARRGLLLQRLLELVE